MGAKEFRLVPKADSCTAANNCRSKTGASGDKPSAHSQPAAVLCGRVSARLTWKQTAQRAPGGGPYRGAPLSKATAPSGLSPFLSTASATEGSCEDNHIFNAILSAMGSLRWGHCLLGPTMTIAEPVAPAEDELLESEIGRKIPKLARTGVSFRTESGDGESAAENLGNLLRQVSKPSIGEIDNLISELQTLRKKLQTDGDRIERDIAKYAVLNQHVMQLTTIISDSVKKLPWASAITR